MLCRPQENLQLEASTVQPDTQQKVYATSNLAADLVLLRAMPHGFRIYACRSPQL